MLLLTSCFGHRIGLMAYKTHFKTQIYLKKTMITHNYNNNIFIIFKNYLFCSSQISIELVNADIPDNK